MKERKKKQLNIEKFNKQRYALNFIYIFSLLQITTLQELIYLLPFSTTEGLL